LFERRVHCQRDGRGGGVAVLSDVDDDALQRHGEFFRSRGDDALVGLVGDEEVNHPRG
jgi:hypothetical protein